MKSLLESGATWASGTILAVIADIDPEVLQWPGGSLVAMMLCVYATIALTLKGMRMVS